MKDYNDSLSLREEHDNGPAHEQRVTEKPNETETNNETRLLFKRLGKHLINDEFRCQCCFRRWVFAAELSTDPLDGGTMKTRWPITGPKNVVEYPLWDNGL